MPTREQLKDALAAAGAGHHDYETVYLRGARDTQWAGWYAAFVLGRLGDFTSPSKLTVWLEEAPGDGDWADSAADIVLGKISSE